MALKIQADAVVKSELESRGIDSSVGVFGSHHVQIGKGKAVRLDVIESAKVPYAGFREVTQVRRGKAGIQQTSSDVLKTLAKPGQLDAGKLLGLLKAQQTHLDRLDKLNQLTPAQRQDVDGLWMFTNAIENLSNAELSAIYQKFTSAEMDLLQTALIREGHINPQANDARMAASKLFDLQALILKEVSNRVSMSVLTDLRTDNPNDETLDDDHIALPQKLSKEYGGVEGVAPVKHNDDMTATNLGILVDVAARSSTARERNGVEEAQKLKQRGMDNVSTKELGDVLRSAEFTINMDHEILLGDTSIIEDPDGNLKNIWHLADQKIMPEDKGDGYLDKREGVEHTVFPEMTRHKRNSDERPIYGALNVQGSKLGAAHVYGHAVIVLKDEVKKRATYTLNDSFFAAKAKITPQRRADFYKLLDGEKGIPQSLKDALRNPDSQERKDLEAWLDSLEQKGEVMLNNSFKRNAGPSSIKKHYNANREGVDSTDGEQSFIGFLIKCFGDSESTRSVMTTYDNIESLLPQLGDLRANALAKAAIDKKNGKQPKAVLTEVQYIEAQIHGPIVPKRDIAEIRVNLQDFAEDQRPAVKAKLLRFQKNTGIKVVIQNFELDSELEKDSDIEKEQNKFNAVHVDQTILATEKEKILENLEASVEQFFTEYPKSKLRLDGEEMGLSGDILGKLAADFTKKLDEVLGGEKHQFTAKLAVTEAFNRAMLEIVDNKDALLKGMADLEFATAAQKKAFAQIVCNSVDVKTVDEMKLIHKHATLQATALAELAAAVPPPTAEQVITRMARLSAELNADLTAYAATLGENAEFNFEAKCTEMKNISAAALTLLKNAQPPVNAETLKMMLAMLDSQEVRGFVGQLDAMAVADGFQNTQDLGNARLFAETLDIANKAFADSVNIEHKRPKAYIGPFSAIPQRLRVAIREVAPMLADALDQAHPAHQSFPQPANPTALPKNKNERKQFLVGVLEEYRQKELVRPERGRSVHGRGHIVRAYIFANVFCNILAEQGIKVDRNVVILGISGHDLGRAGLGNDKWERQSGVKTNAALREHYGENTTGEPYEQEMANSILSVEIKPPNARKRHVPVSPTLEAQLLQNADCLDIGRTAEFDDYYFDFLRDKNGQLTPEAKAIRDELIKEADILQRLTNPYVANRSILQKIDRTLFDGTDKQTEQLLSAQKEELNNSIENDFIEEAETVSNEAFFNNVEKAIREHRNMFPLLSQYYLDAE